MANKIQISYKELLSYAPGVRDELKIGVAISGGRDSVALLHCLNTLKTENANNNPNLKIIAVNVEHGIRGEESLRDSEFVRDLCARWDIPLLAFSVSAPEFAKENGYTLEQAGRILRYEIFDKLLKEDKCDLIALAHHLDDQIETVFMRILRGTGIRGLIGMRKQSGKYIRPLLDFDRECIDGYIKDNGLSYVEDESNRDTSYTRNFLRQQLGEIKKRFPQMGEAVARLSANAEEADEFISAHTPEIDVKDNVAYIKTSDCADSVIAKRLILKSANALGVMQDIEDRHYALVLKLLSAESGKYLMLTHGLCVHKEGEYIAFTLKEENSGYCEQEFCEGSFDILGVTVKSVEKSTATFGGSTLYVDADKIPDGAVIRVRKDGDYICKFGGGTKSLGDFLTDKKIPLRKRDGLKVIAKDSKIYAVFGVDIASDARIDENTRRVYALKTDSVI